MRADSSFSSVQALHLHRDLVEAQRIQLAPEEDVGDDVEVLAQREVLEHRGDAEIERRAGSGSVTGLPPKRDRAGAGLVDAGENLHQRRLAGAVVADQRDHFAGVHVELDVGQGRDRAEVLRDAAQAQHQLARLGRVLWSCQSWDGYLIRSETDPASSRIPSGRRRRVSS